MGFESLKLSSSVYKAIQELDFVSPTPIQEQSFSKIKSGKDYIGIAPTGTGKTLAYALPLVSMLSYSNQREPRILVVVPTRELVVQSVNEINRICKYNNLVCIGVYGGTNIRTQRVKVGEKHDILVATPGRLVDLALSRAVKLKGIRKLVLDEFDEILNLGFRPQLMTILDLLPNQRQNLLFSATMSEDVEGLVNEYFNNPQKVELAPHGTPVELVEQKAYELPNFNTKVAFLTKLILENDEFSKLLIFVKTKKMADKLFDELNPFFENQINVIHSNKSQNYRIRVVEEFEKGEVKMLIATDLIARGVDITDITHVINFDIPDKPINYIHRIGRTGRADKPGKAVSLVADYEKDLILDIEELMNKEIELSDLPFELEFIDSLIDEEKPGLGGDKTYYHYNDLSKSKGAFHSKKLKNQKVNLGSPFRNKKKKYKKPIKRSGR